MKKGWECYFSRFFLISLGLLMARFKWHNLLWLTITALLLVALLVGRIALPWKTLVSKIGFKKPEARLIMISIFGWSLAGSYLSSRSHSLCFSLPQRTCRSCLSLQFLHRDPCWNRSSEHCTYSYS